MTTQNPTVFIALAASAVAAGLLAFAVVRGVLRAHERLAAQDGGENFLRMLLAPVAALLLRRRSMDIQLDRQLARIEQYVVQSGGRFLNGATGAEIFAARFVLPVLALVFLPTIGMLLRIPSGWTFLGSVAFAVMLYAWPEQGVAELAKKRTAQFSRDLPQVLDVMSLVSDSGGDLYSAIKTAVDVTPDGPVREELSRALAEVTIGSSLAQALNNIVRRIGTYDANAVFSTMAQALEMGTSVADNLAQASALIRKDARIRAQEKAQKAVVAMTFPLLLLILPGVFIVLFAPMIIQYATMPK